MALRSDNVTKTNETKRQNLVPKVVPELNKLYDEYAAIQLLNHENDMTRDGYSLSEQNDLFRVYTKQKTNVAHVFVMNCTIDELNEIHTKLHESTDPFRLLTHGTSSLFSYLGRMVTPAAASTADISKPSPFKGIKST